MDGRRVPCVLFLVAIILFAFGGLTVAGDSGTGAIEGRVFSVHLEPIEGATLTLISGDGEEENTTTSAPDGSYSLDEVPSGSYRFVVSAPGYYALVRAIAVEPGETAMIDVALEPVPQPWVDGPNEWTGFISCWITVIDCGLFDPNHDTSTTTTLDSGLATATAALEWDPNVFSGADELRLVVRDGWGGKIAEVTGGSPLELRIDDGFGTAKSLSFHVEPTTGTTLAYQQTVTLWWALHYIEPAPDDYSPLPGS